MKKEHAIYASLGVIGAFIVYYSTRNKNTLSAGGYSGGYSGGYGTVIAPTRIGDTDVKVYQDVSLWQEETMARARLESLQRLEKEPCGIYFKEYINTSQENSRRKWISCKRELFFQRPKLVKIINDIKSNTTFFNHLKSKAKAEKTSVKRQIRLEAVRILKLQRTFRVRPQGSGGNLIIAQNIEDCGKYQRYSFNWFLCNQRFLITGKVGGY